MASAGWVSKNIRQSFLSNTAQQIKLTMIAVAIKKSKTVKWKGATGNIATEDVVHCLHQMGYETGVNNLKMIELAKEVELYLGRKLPGKIKGVLSSVY